MKNETIKYLQVHLLDLQDALYACEWDEDRAEIETNIKTVIELIEWWKSN